MGMDKIEEVLTRGVEEILPSKEGLANLMRTKKITVYQGFDPSSKNLHIGHLIGIRKLAQFQKLGHKVIFLIGDFTGMIGDPTDKAATRVRLSHRQVLENTKGYKKQIEQFINLKGPNAAEIKFNSSWLAPLKFEEIVELSSKFTVQQIIERDFFQKRIKDKKPIYLHEFLYPLMQGYDSVVMDVNLEIGGADQLFNMMAGRHLMKILKNKEKYVLTLKILEDPSGKKMGKSEGNTINLTDKSEDIFGKIMALPDSFINLGLELLTDLPLNLIKTKKPLDLKKMIAYDVVKQVKGEDKAKIAQEKFEKIFQKGEVEFKQKVPFRKTLIEVVENILGSKSKAKRLIKGGGVDINGKNIVDIKYILKGGEKIKIGKKTFVKVIPKK